MSKKGGIGHFFSRSSKKDDKEKEQRDKEEALNEAKNEPLRIFLAGRQSGKSALVQRFTQGFFDTTQQKTPAEQPNGKHTVYQTELDRSWVAVDFHVLPGDAKDEVLNDAYLAAEGYAICYDITSRQSYKDVQANVINRLFTLRETLEGVPMVIIGTKLDEANDHREVSTEEGKQLAGVVGAAHFETSALSGFGVSEAIDEVLRRVRRFREAKAKKLAIESSADERSAQLGLKGLGYVYNPGDFHKLNQPDLKFIPDVAPPIVACGVVECLIDHLVIPGDTPELCKSINEEYVNVFALFYSTFSTTIAVVDGLARRFTNMDSTLSDCLVYWAKDKFPTPEESTNKAKYFSDMNKPAIANVAPALAGIISQFPEDFAELTVEKFEEELKYKLVNAAPPKRTENDRLHTLVRRASRMSVRRSKKDVDDIVNQFLTEVNASEDEIKSADLMEPDLEGDNTSGPSSSPPLTRTPSHSNVNEATKNTFDVDMPVVTYVTTFLSMLVNTPRKPLTIEGVNYLRDLATFLVAHKKQPNRASAVDLSVCPKVLYPINASTGIINTELLPGTFGFDDLDPVEVARQMTLADFDVLCAITPREFVGCRWTKKEKKLVCPSLSLFFEHFNKQIETFRYLILSKDSVSARVAVIEKMIAIMNKLREYDNFSSLMAIVSLLQSAAIARLFSTWSNVEKSKKDSLQKNHKLMSGQGSYRRYRMALMMAEADDKFVMPFLGVHLTDLVFIEDGNPATLRDGQLVNLAKRRMSYRVISHISAFQKKRPPFVPVYNIQQYLASLPTIDEDAGHARSEQLEPNK